MRTMRLAILTAAIAATTFISSARGDDSTMFPFVVEKGAPDNITNVETWDGAARSAAGSDGFLTVKRDAFATSAGKTRLFGTNICGMANSREKATRLAETLARFGLNAIRLHHMDNRDFWGANFDKGTTEIDPARLDLYDYLVARMIEHGVYVDVNLHVSRTFREIDGFANADQLPTFDKGVDNFDRRMIEFQKKFARELLGHVNPHTGKTYVDDPGIGLVEINNENSVVSSWAWRSLDRLPDPYSVWFQNIWNDWLLKKYGSNAALRDAWGCKTIPFGEDQIAANEINSDFAFGAKGNWSLETDGVSRCDWSVLPPKDSGLDASALRFRVEKVGAVYWRPQFHRVGLKTREGEPCRFTFKIRSDKPETFRISLMTNHDPWQTSGFLREVEANEEWRDVAIDFVGAVDDDNLRLTFSAFREGDVLELADLSFREGGVLGLAEDVSLERKEVPVLKRGEPDVLGKRARADFVEFLRDLETSYWGEMFAFVKSLGAKVPVAGTQLHYGFMDAQARLDYCDNHAYWNHPSFPHKAWDGSDWLVKNTALVDHPTDGAIAKLAASRILGRPYSCSEYDHPFPNQYCAEGNLMLAAVAAFQDWSATFQFAWSHGDDYERRRVTPFFDMCANPTKLAHLPACYGIFARGDVRPGPGKFVYAPKISRRAELDAVTEKLGISNAFFDGLGVDSAMSLAVYSGVEITDLALATNDAVANATRVSGWNELPDELGSPEKKEIVNEFGELKWSFPEEGKGTFVVDTARTKVFSGFVSKPCAFDGVNLKIGETRLGWATVSLVKARGLSDADAKNGTLSRGSYLLAATGDVRNTGEVLETLDGNVTTASAFGGALGTEPVLLEGVPATIALANVKASDVEVYALDATGARVQPLKVADASDGATFEIGSEFKTVWYELIVK